jgi:hypothetical protein
MSASPETEEELEPAAEITQQAAPEVTEQEEPDEPAAAVPIAHEEAPDGEGSTAGVGDGSEVDLLFASLRDSMGPADEDAAPREEPETGEAVEGHDWLEERDSRLLPITNRALRGTKKSITELQNIALDNLRTSEEWRPEVGTLVDALGADLIAMWGESFAAGHAVAEQMTGSKLKRPPTPQPHAVKEFSTALSHDVSAALDQAGAGQRERQSAASRVFRVWRSDEAEQRIRELAIRAYQQGVERSVAQG